MKMLSAGDGEVRQFVRFCAVGVLCTGLDAAIFYTVGLFAPYRVALVSGYLLSLVVNYVLTVRWTFKTKATVGNAVGVVAAHMFNLFVVRMALMYVLVDFMGFDSRIAYLPTLAVSAVVNYFLVRLAVKKG